MGRIIFFIEESLEYELVCLRFSRLSCSVNKYLVGVFPAERIPNNVVFLIYLGFYAVSKSVFTIPFPCSYHYQVKVTLFVSFHILLLFRIIIKQVELRWCGHVARTIKTSNT